MLLERENAEQVLSLKEKYSTSYGFSISGDGFLYDGQKEKVMFNSSFW